MQAALGGRCGSHEPPREPALPDKRVLVLLVGAVGLRVLVPRRRAEAPAMSEFTDTLWALARAEHAFNSAVIVAVGARLDQAISSHPSYQNYLRTNERAADDARARLLALRRGR